MGSSGGKPPEMTTVAERAMNSMPSVVMKEGIAKRSVMKPLSRPTPAATSEAGEDSRREGRSRRAAASPSPSASARTRSRRKCRTRPRSSARSRRWRPAPFPATGRACRAGSRTRGTRRSELNSNTTVQHDQQNDAGEFRLFQVDLEQTFHAPRGKERSGQDSPAMLLERICSSRRHSRERDPGGAHDVQPCPLSRGRRLAQAFLDEIDDRLGLIGIDQRLAGVDVGRRRPTVL